MNGYLILEDVKLIIGCYTGHHDLSILTNTLEDAIKDKRYNPSYALIADLRFSDQIGMEEIHLLATYIQNTLGEHTNRQLAILTDTSHQAALSYLLSSYTGIYTFDYAVFSTWAGALSWLKIPEHLILNLLNRYMLKLRLRITSSLTN